MGKYVVSYFSQPISILHSKCFLGGQNEYMQLFYAGEGGRKFIIAECEGEVILGRKRNKIK